jgi:fatty-acyl-CoA synthase
MSTDAAGPPASTLSDVPAPGQAPLPAADAAEMLRANAADPEVAARPALAFGERRWTHGEVYAEACRFARLLLALGEERPEHRLGRPVHVGVLADNTPDYVFALAGAALAGATVVGLNHTRSEAALWRDLSHTDVDAVLTEPGHLDRLGAAYAAGPGEGPPVLLSRRFDDAAPARHPALGDVRDLGAALAGHEATDPGLSPGPDTIWALIFTSGTSSDPKAVICTQRRLLVTGNRMRMLLGIGPDDVGYVCMPLFHSNALMVGWAPSVVAGASVGLARRFSASGWLADVRRYGATWFNYTGKPLSYLLATPEQPDDADNPLRVAFGNEGSPEVLDGFARRFDVRVIDAFGSTEGAIAVNRDAPMRHGAMGVAGPTVMVVDEAGVPRPPAAFDADGRLTNPEECVGEIVNTAGGGPFEGYYNNPEATAATLRDGWYWSGDLGYLDEDRYLFFAGRTADWIRVDGENFPAGPIDEALRAHPDVIIAAAYGVPDVHSGDQVMASLVLRPGSDFDPAAFGEWVDADPALAPKWRPRFLRVAEELPTTGTNKVVKRTLVRQKYRPDRCGDDALFHRDRGESHYRPFTGEDAEALLGALRAAGRDRFWDL